MSQQNVQTVRTGYEAFNRQDIPAVLETYDPQIEWIEPGSGEAQARGRAPAGTYRGPQTVAAEVFASVPRNFDELRADPEQYIDAGEHVVVVGRFRGKTKRGTTLDAPFVHVLGLRNGKITHFRNYVDAAAWATAWAD